MNARNAPGASYTPVVPAGVVRAAAINRPRSDPACAASPARPAARARSPTVTAAKASVNASIASSDGTVVIISPRLESAARADEGRSLAAGYVRIAGEAA